MRYAPLLLLVLLAGCAGGMEQAYRSAFGPPTYEARYDPANDHTTHRAGPFVLAALTDGAPTLTLAAATSCPGQAACEAEEVLLSVSSVDEDGSFLQPGGIYILAGGLRFHVPDPPTPGDVRAAVPAADFRALMGLAGDWTIHVGGYDYALPADEQEPLRQLAARVR